MSGVLFGVISVNSAKKDRMFFYSEVQSKNLHASLKGRLIPFSEVQGIYIDRLHTSIHLEYEFSHWICDLTGCFFKPAS